MKYSETGGKKIYNIQAQPEIHLVSKSVIFNGNRYFFSYIKSYTL